MSNIPKKNLVIIEGPTGAGKSTYIDDVFQCNRSTLTVDSNFQQISKGRFTFDECAHEEAIKNDKLKLTKAFNFLSLDDTDTVLIDRLFFSDLVYEHIRNYGRSVKSSSWLQVSQPISLLERFADFIIQQSREVEFYQDFQIELVLICPENYQLLADRRKKNPSKAYPFACLDWYLYNQIILAINKYVGRRNTRVSAIYRINNILLTLINE